MSGSLPLEKLALEKYNCEYIFQDLFIPVIFLSGKLPERRSIKWTISGQEPLWIDAS